MDIGERTPGWQDRFNRFKKARSFWMILFATGVGVLAAWLLHARYQARMDALQSRLASSAKAADSVQVLVPQAAMKAGDRLERKRLAARAMDRAATPQGYIPAAQFETVEGQTLARDMLPGQAFTWDSLAQSSEAPSEPTQHAGLRRVRLLPEELRLLGTRLKTGDRVDLIWLGQDEGVHFSRPLVQDAAVLVHPIPTPSDKARLSEDEAVIEVQATGHAISQLLLARSSGNIAVLVRPPGELRASAYLPQPGEPRVQKPVPVIYGGRGGSKPLASALSSRKEGE